MAATVTEVGVTGAKDASAALDALLGHERLQAAMRELFGGDLTRVRPGLPRRLTSDTSEALRAPATVVVLGRVPFELHAPSLLLGHPSAQTLIDRMLGGSQRVITPSPPSEGECGVLAYAVARTLEALESPFVLRDVYAASRDALHATLAACVLWPLALETSFGALELSLVMPPATAGLFPLRFKLRLSLHDHLEPALLAQLSEGQVLASDALAFLTTREGLHGRGVLHVEGMEAPIVAQLSGSTAHALPAGMSESLREPLAPLELVLAEREVALLELADIAAGATPAFSALAHTQVSLRQHGQTIARGELGTLRGALCVRINRRESAA